MVAYLCPEVERVRTKRVLVSGVCRLPDAEEEEGGQGGRGREKAGGFLPPPVAIHNSYIPVCVCGNIHVSSN